MRGKTTFWWLLFCIGFKHTFAQSTLNEQVETNNTLAQWNIIDEIDSDCNTVEMAEVTAFFCPELKHLYSTQELLDKGLIWATDRLTQFPSLDIVKVASISKETNYEGALIILETGDGGKNNIHRVRVISDEQGSPYDLEMTMLFNLVNIQQTIEVVTVFDDFIVFTDESNAMLIAIRPEFIGQEASYAQPSDPSRTTNFIVLYSTPIVSHSVLTTDVAGKYLVNFITYNATDPGQTLIPDSYDLYIDAIAGTADFSQLNITRSNATFLITAD